MRRKKNASPVQSLHRAVMLVLILLVASRSGAAQKLSGWTSWTSTNDPLVQWRAQIEDWGKNMSPVCQVELRIDGEGAANFRFELIFQPEGEGASTTGRRPGRAYGVTRDKDYKEQILGCRRVNGAMIDRVARRTGGSESATRQPSNPDGRQNLPPRPSAPAGRGTTRQIPDVIHFPGPRQPYRGPSLKPVSMDARSLEKIRFESTLVGGRLHDWRPVRLWAQHRPAVISQSDWDMLGRQLSRIDSRILRGLADDASRLAGQYAAGSNLRQFWRAMAGFYEHHAKR